MCCDEPHHDVRWETDKDELWRVIWRLTTIIPRTMSHGFTLEPTDLQHRIAKVLATCNAAALPTRHDKQIVLVLLASAAGADEGWDAFGAWWRPQPTTSCWTWIASWTLAAMSRGKRLRPTCLRR